jgi:ATP-dependent DNA ligase
MGIAEANVRHPEGKQRHAGRANEALAQLDQEEGGHPVEFARLAHTFEELEQTSSRLTLIEPSVWVEPRIVIEVLADEITRSPTHTAGKVGAEPGYALRFPRLVSFREGDKQPEDATTVQELIELYNSQGKR